MWSSWSSRTDIRMAVQELLASAVTDQYPLRTTIDPSDPYIVSRPKSAQKPWIELLEELNGPNDHNIPLGCHMKRHAALARYFEEPHKFYVIMVPDMQPLTGPISREEAQDLINEINTPNVAKKVKRKEI